MTIYEAKAELSKPLEFANPAQIKARKFLERVAILRERIGHETPQPTECTDCDGEGKVYEECFSCGGTGKHTPVLDWAEIGEPNMDIRRAVESGLSLEIQVKSEC